MPADRPSPLGHPLPPELRETGDVALADTLTGHMIAVKMAR